ncbi:MAG: HAD family hydrolase [Sulfolobales archaeon]
MKILGTFAGRWQEVIGALIMFVDLDGTLVVSPTSNVIKEACSYIATNSGTSVSEVEQRLWRLHIELVKRSDPLAFDWDYVYREVSRFFGVSSGYSIEKRLHELCHLSKLLDNAGRVLEELAHAVETLILATNGLIKYQKCIIETLGLDKYFDDIFTPDNRGCLKNCEKFYAVPAESDRKIAVGDNYTFDVYYPKKFGLKAIHVLRSEFDPYLRWLKIKRIYEPDAIITSLKHLPGTLLKL